MASKGAGSARGLGRQVNRAVEMLARERAGLGARPGFGNFRREELSGGRFAGQSMLGSIIPASVKPVPVILGTVTGVGFNSAAGRLMESPAVGINANPLLSRVILAVLGVVGHVALRKDFTLGFMVGQFPGLIDAGVSAIMDMALGETASVDGIGMDGASQQVLAELRQLRRKLEGEPGQPASSLPMGVRARSAA